MTVESRAASGTIRANLDMPPRCRPRELIVRLRHPTGKPMTAVKVNGADWRHFEPENERLRIVNPDQPRYEIVASYRSQVEQKVSGTVYAKHPEGRFPENGS